MSYFDGSTITRRGGSSILNVNGVPTIRFWVLENPRTLVDRFVVVFDIPTDPVQSGILPAVCMNRIGHLFHDEVDTQWLSGVIKNSVPPRNGDSYHIIGFDELPPACQKAASQEIASLLLGGTPDSPVALRRFSAVYQDHTWAYFLAENEAHATEQALDAFPDEKVLEVFLSDYAIL
jgi:hypothetical protein